MSSIYSSNRNRTNKTQNISKSHKEKSPVNNKKNPKKILITSVIVNVIVAALFIAFLFIVTSRDIQREVYAKLVLLPIAAFVGAFISVLLNKDLLINLAGSAAVLLLAYLIFVDFSFMVIPWLIFYLISAVLGIAISFIAGTFR